MDALLSLPVMGYFLMPGITSYSTSLNLLFFYMTWSTLVLSHPPLKVEIFASLAPRIVFWFLPSTLFLLFDTIIPSLSQSIKAQGADGLPTRTGGVKVSRKNSKPEWYQVVGLSVFNILLGVGLQAGVELLFTEVFGIRSALKIATTLPMPWSIFKEVGRGLVMREVLQYYLHRFLLHPSRSNYLSNLHRSFAHSITAPYSFTAHYDHPLPYLFHTILPTYLPSLLFRTHLLTHTLLLCIITLEETFALSGYSIVPGIMLGGIARRQNLHYESRGRGNFAPWGFMDWVHGTSIGGDVVDDLGDEAEKHHVKERSGKAFGQAKDSAEKGVRSWNARRKSVKK